MVGGVQAAAGWAASGRETIPGEETPTNKTPHGSRGVPACFKQGPAADEATAAANYKNIMNSFIHDVSDRLASDSSEPAKVNKIKVLPGTSTEVDASYSV